MQAMNWLIEFIVKLSWLVSGAASPHLGRSGDSEPATPARVVAPRLTDDNISRPSQRATDVITEREIEILILQRRELEQEIEKAKKRLSLLRKKSEESRRKTDKLLEKLDLPLQLKLELLHRYDTQDRDRVQENK